MQYREIGKTGVRVSEISFGCWTMGGLNFVDGVANGWPDVDEQDITAAVKVGLDAGVTHFDNADVYGNGRAERMLARVLKRLGVKSEAVIIASKVGHFPGTAEHAYAPEHLRHQLEQSLVNLGRDYLDLYYFHHGDFGPGDRYLPAAAEALDRFVQEGKVRLKGLSAYSEDDFERLVPTIRPQVLQSWANALDDRYLRSGSRVDRLMERHGLSFVAFSPLAQGRLLARYDPAKPPVFAEGDHRRGSEEYTAAALAALQPKLQQLKARFGATTEDLAAMALNYVLAAPRVACVIPGFRNERQARCNVAAAGRALAADDLVFIRKTLAG